MVENINLITAETLNQLADVMGKTIIHSKFGRGIITTQEENEWTVKFEAETKKLHLVTCLSRGLVSAEDEKLDEALKAIHVACEQVEARLNGADVDTSIGLDIKRPKYDTSIKEAVKKELNDKRHNLIEAWEITKEEEAAYMELQEHYSHPIVSMILGGLHIKAEGLRITIKSLRKRLEARNLEVLDLVLDDPKDKELLALIAA